MRVIFAEGGSRSQIIAWLRRATRNNASQENLQSRGSAPADLILVDLGFFVRMSHNFALFWSQI